MNSIQENIYNCILRIRPISKLVPETMLIDGLLDSFDLVMLVSEIEQSFGVTISAEEISRENFSTVETLVCFVEKRIANR